MVKAIVVGLAICVAGCIISRKSSDLECDRSADCTGGRSCNGGYCVTDGCPAVCTSCDTSARACTITCATPGECSAPTCPSGFSCDITCASGSSCGNITCGDEACRVTCEGSDSCGTIDCSSSCGCDVSCSTGNCGVETCPSNACTTGNNCDSGAKGNCNTCS